MRPNIVLIMADQFRKDYIGAYGNPFVHTPRLDSLTEHSKRFDRAYVANPICMPNRMSLLTGRLPSNHGVWTNGVCVQDCGKTLMWELKRAGYQTASVGKLHLSPCGPQSAQVSFESGARWKEPPAEEASWEGYFGLDYVELTIGHTGQRAHYYKWFLEHGGRDEMFGVDAFPGLPTNGDDLTGLRRMPARLCSSTFVGERAANYLAKVRDPQRPFFLLASFPDPHHPYTSCPEDYSRYCSAPFKEPVPPVDLDSRPAHYRDHYRGSWHRSGKQEAVYPQGLPKEAADARIRHTYAMVERIDRNVGVILDALEQQGLRENTIVVFTADHGELLGDHGLWQKGPFFYEGLLNVPLTVGGPGISAGSTDALFSSVDLAPTLCGLAGLPAPDYVDGCSQAGVVRGEREPPRDCCLVEYRNGYGEADCNVNVLVTPEMKLAVYETGEMELNDLACDPGETCNHACDPAYAAARRVLEHRMLLEKLRCKRRGDRQYGHS